MFSGHTDINGGLSGVSGVGHVGSAMQTTYQRHYNII